VSSGEIGPNELRSPPRLARAVPGVSEAASAPLPNSKTYRRYLPPALPPSAVGEGELVTELLMSLEKTVAPGVTRPVRATSSSAQRHHDPLPGVVE
jgi:hypothetical protein